MEKIFQLSAVIITLKKTLKLPHIQTFKNNEVAKFNIFPPKTPICTHIKVINSNLKLKKKKERQQVISRSLNNSRSKFSE